jgi:hypothetical protein
MRQSYEQRFTAARQNLNKASIALVEGLQIPLHSILLCDLVLGAHVSPTGLAPSHTKSLATQNDVEIHTIDARVRVVFDTEINVLLNAKTEVSCATSATVKARNVQNLTGVGEVRLLQFVFLHSKTLVENGPRLLTRDTDVARYFLISANAEGPDGETS